MYYAPHILQKRVASQSSVDEYGRPVRGEEQTEWLTVCRCRCDSNSVVELTDENGKVFKPELHVVCEGNRPDITVSDYVRILEGEDVIGNGKVLRPKKLNYLPYAEFWI